MEGRYIKESDFEKCIDSRMEHIQKEIDDKQNSKIQITSRQCFESQNILLIGLCNDLRNAEHVYKEDVVEDTLAIMHKEIVKK